MNSVLENVNWWHLVLHLRLASLETAAGDELHEILGMTFRENNLFRTIF